MSYCDWMLMISLAYFLTGQGSGDHWPSSPPSFFETPNKCQILTSYKMVDLSVTLTKVELWKMLIHSSVKVKYRLKVGLSPFFGANPCSMRPIVKWQNTTRSLSREPELTEGTWLQLMCCAPSRSHCPKFRSNRVYKGIPEYSGGDGEDGVD